MGRIQWHRGTIGLFMFLAVGIWAQEPEASADVFLEDYSDAFQEAFFEGLKHYGIENYDKAIQYFLECLEEGEATPVVAHQLARSYLKNNQPSAAEAYGIQALSQNPENRWYLQTLMAIVKVQGKELNRLEGQIPLRDPKLQENLALLLYEQGQFAAAKEQLENIPPSVNRTVLSYKIEEALAVTQEHSSNDDQDTDAFVGEEVADNPIEAAIAELEGLIAATNYKTLLKQANGALEAFPNHPYFYYASGLAYEKEGDCEAAVDILETGTDYLLEEGDLAYKIYGLLASCYQQMGNPSKANTYLRKIKKGS